MKTKLFIAAVAGLLAIGSVFAATSTDSNAKASNCECSNCGSCCGTSCNCN